jgi:hypothetical protein
MAVTIGVSIPDETVRKLDETCQLLGLNRSSAVSLAISKLYQAQIAPIITSAKLTPQGEEALKKLNEEDNG